MTPRPEGRSPARGDESEVSRPGCNEWNRPRPFHSRKRFLRGLQFRRVASPVERCAEAVDRQSTSCETEGVGRWGYRSAGSLKGPVLSQLTDQWWYPSSFWGTLRDGGGCRRYVGRRNGSFTKGKKPRRGCLTPGVKLGRLSSKTPESRGSCRAQSSKAARKLMGGWPSDRGGTTGGGKPQGG